MDEFDRFCGLGGCVDVYRWCGTMDGMDPWMLIMYLWVDSAHKLYITNAFVSG
jgi:hypothetical protein